MKKLITIKFALLAIFAGLFLTVSIQAATYTVNSTTDPGDGTCDASCTLRDAIDTANMAATNDVIEFDATVFSTPQTITLTAGELTIANNGSLTINGTGADQLSVSGNNAGRVFSISYGANATINAITITDGNITDGNGVGTADSGRGGGIYNFGGTTTLNNSTVSGNSASSAGGGIYNGGTTTLNNSTVSGNSASSAGGGIFNFGSEFTRGITTLNNSTVSGNSTSNSGGGIFNGGRGTTTLNTSTVSGNEASNSGGGIFNSGVITTTLNNSIIANSINGDCINSATLNASYSLIEDGLGCVNGTNDSNQTGDPMLGPLADNGGSTMTHALLPGSIAIDAGNSTLTTDQRGFTRPVDDPSVTNAAGGNGSDIGSFEVQNPDSDGDGILDDMDNCLMTFNPDQADFDQDGIGDACDDDDDNDGVADVNDAFPFDPNESVDTDGDGIGNNADLDDDGDGQLDADEIACGSNPLDSSSVSPDADGDHIPDCVDPDDDNDGIPDTCDIDQNPGAIDFDRDGIVDSSECDTEIGPPIDKDQCKKGGFMRFNNPTFRNQGQCVSFVQSNRPR